MLEVVTSYILILLFNLKLPHQFSFLLFLKSQISKEVGTELQTSHDITSQALTEKTDNTLPSIVLDSASEPVNLKNRLTNATHLLQPSYKLYAKSSLSTENKEDHSFKLSQDEQVDRQSVHQNDDEIREIKSTPKFKLLKPFSSSLKDQNTSIVGNSKIRTADEILKHISNIAINLNLGNGLETSGEQKEEVTALESTAENAKSDTLTTIVAISSPSASPVTETTISKKSSHLMDSLIKEKMDLAEVKAVDNQQPSASHIEDSSLISTDATQTSIEKLLLKATMPYKTLSKTISSTQRSSTSIIKRYHIIRISVY